MAEIETAEALQQSLVGRKIVGVEVRMDAETEDYDAAIAGATLVLDSGVKVHITAHGLHTEGWPIFDLEDDG